MKRLILFSVLFLLINSIEGISQEKKQADFGVSYFGELALKPGVEIDYGFVLTDKGTLKEGKKRYLRQQLVFRIAQAFYRNPRSSNNYLTSIKLNYAFKWQRSDSERYFSIEPSARIGYLHYAYIGKIYQTTSTGFSSSNNAGTNSLIFGGGLDFTGHLFRNTNWIFGTDYFYERTEDKLGLHRFFLKLGTRIKFKG